MKSPAFRAVGVAAVLGLAVLFACSDDHGDGHSHGPFVCDGTGGKVNGAADTHCGSKVVVVDPAACTATTQSADIAPLHLHDAGHGGDGGVNPEHRPTMPGDEGDDDHCKYHVKWSSTEACGGRDIFFTVTLTNKSDGAPVRGAPIRIEAYLDETHPAPNTDQQWTETGPGVYKVGPVQFDHSGNWNVRFHFNEQCRDNERSPHGHAAFFVAIP